MDSTSISSSNQSTDVDKSHLNILAVFHYVLGGLSILSVGFFVLHYLLMSSFFNSPQMWQNVTVEAEVAGQQVQYSDAADGAKSDAVYEPQSGEYPQKYERSHEVQSQEVGQPQVVEVQGQGNVVRADQMPPEFMHNFFSIMKIFYLIGGFFSIAAGVLLILSGKFIQEMKHHTFSMVIAAITCLSFPFGTILGVLTLIKLQSEPVKRLYAAR